MSAIAGVIYFNGRPARVEEISTITAAMARRGPDGRFHFVKNNIALGQCISHTTPESLEETLPLPNEDESVIVVMDGRVDNYAELRLELLKSGAHLRTRADSELILRGYELWGEQCAQHIIGECVFVIFDAKRQMLFGCRDAAGARHFYTHAGKGWFAFASEIGGLLAISSIDRAPNEERMLDFLVNAYDRDDQVATFYKHIHRLPAGHVLRVDANSTRTTRYWDPRQLPLLPMSSLQECSEAFFFQLRTATESRLRTLGPVGAMLSGGLDSSSIVAILGQDFAHRLNGPLHTFTLVRPPGTDCAEWRNAALVSEAQQTISHTLDPSVVDESWQELLCEALDADEPLRLLPGITNWLVYRAAKQAGCAVVFDGMAADTLFWSTDTSLQWAWSQRRPLDCLGVLVAAHRYGGFGTVAATVRPTLRPAIPRYLIEWRRQRIQSRDAATGHMGSIRPGIASTYLTLRETMRARQRSADRLGINPSGDVFVRGILSFAHEVYGGVAQHVGVDPRSPFSDRRVIEFAVQMPEAAKAAVWRYKRLLRMASVKHLPAQILLRDGRDGHPGSYFWERLSLLVAQDELVPTMPAVPWVDQGGHEAGRRRILEGATTEEAGYHWLAAEVLKRWSNLHRAS